MLWTQVITGLEVDDLTAVRVLGRRHLARTPRTPGETRRPARGVTLAHADRSFTRRPSGW
jgi:hypothetical protein